MHARRTFRSAWFAVVTCMALVGAACSGGHAPQGEHAGEQPAKEAGEQGTGQQETGESGTGEHDGDQYKYTMEMGDTDFFKVQYSHNVPYAVYTPTLSPNAEVNEALTIYNVNVFQWKVLLVMLLVFLPVLYIPRCWWARVLRGWCLWIRDEMVYPVMGKEDGRRFAPYFIFLFFFIMFMNVIGMIPSSPLLSTYTPTGTPYVTGALAAITFATMIGFGMQQQGVVGFFRNLVPHGLPLWLLPIMIPVEIIALVVKPVALTIRLFANMLAGHLVIASLVGMVFLFAKLMGGSALAYGTVVPAVGMAVFVFIIEAFITLLQAYIFVYLSILFLNQSMHPAH